MTVLLRIDLKNQEINKFCTKWDEWEVYDIGDYEDINYHLVRYGKMDFKIRNGILIVSNDYVRGVDQGVELEVDIDTETKDIELSIYLKGYKGIDNPHYYCPGWPEVKITKNLKLIKDKTLKERT